MNIISQDAIADIHLEISWESAEALHSEHYQACRINFWRDCMPEELNDSLYGKAAGDVVEFDLAPGVVVSSQSHRYLEGAARF